MNRILVVIGIWGSLFSLVNAQGLATNDVERSAVEMLADFAAGPVRLPDEHAVVIREKLVSYFDGHEIDSIYLFCEDRQRTTSSRFSATGEIGRVINLDSEQRWWVQYLRTPTHRAQRSGGSAFGKFAGEVVEDVTMDPEDSMILRLPRGHDYPLFRPIAPDADIARQMVHSASYGRLLLNELDFMGAEKLEDGTIQSDWARKLWRVQILFDPKQGNSPTKVIHFGNLEDDGPIISVHLIRWVEWKFGSRDSLWVPASYRFRHSTPKYGVDYEIESHLRWADTTQASVMPELISDAGNDWREKIRERFDEDWSDRYADWLRKNQGKTGVVPTFK